MIDVVNVTHHYGVRPVLRNINLSVREGEIVALMGPNGMGKSTLLAVVAGALAPIKGHVTIAGLRRRSSPENELEIRRKVVYLPAEPWLPLTRTGREWILSAGRAWGVDDDRLLEHGDRLLQLFNLDEHADETIMACSSGQRKKIALCGALITDAPILLLDEPFAGGLDPSGILALKRVLQWHAQRRSRTVIMATPVPELIEELAARVAVIREGRLVAFDTIAGLRSLTGSTGSLDELYERIASPDTTRKVEAYFAELT